MKKVSILMLVALAFVAVAGFTNTCSAQAEEDEVQLFQTMYGMEKRSLISEAMELSADQDKAFWPVYEEFEKERRVIGKERIALIKEYMDTYTNATDEQLDAIAKRALANESAFTKLESAYYDKMKKVTASGVAFRWLQVERYLNTSIRAAIQDELPFMPNKK
jgi:predicted DNA-binding ribbon-helix-helix protein